MDSKKKFSSSFIDYIKKFFIRRKEYLHNKDYFIKINDKRMIHLNNVNYRIPFSIYIKVENDLLQKQNKKIEINKVETERKALYEKYGYKYYPIVKYTEIKKQKKYWRHKRRFVMVRNKRKIKNDNRNEVSLEYVEEMSNINKARRKKEKKKMKLKNFTKSTITFLIIVTMLLTIVAPIANIIYSSITTM